MIIELTPYHVLTSGDLSVNPFCDTISKVLSLSPYVLRSNEAVGRGLAIFGPKRHYLIIDLSGRSMDINCPRFDANHR